MLFQDMKQLRPLVFGLTRNCPFSCDNPSDCLLHNIRALSEKERRLWVESLTEKQCRDIYQRHEKCLQAKQLASGSESA